MARTIYQNKAKSRSSLSKFDIVETPTHTVNKVSKLTNTIAARLEEYMVVQEIAKSGLRRLPVPTGQVVAKLVKPISYIKDGRNIVVASGTVICVDQISQIALIGQDHVDISEDEYTPVQ